MVKKITRKKKVKKARTKKKAIAKSNDMEQLVFGGNVDDMMKGLFDNVRGNQ